MRYVLIAHPGLPFSIPVEAPLPADEVTGEVELSAAELERWWDELAVAVVEMIERN